MTTQNPRSARLDHINLSVRNLDESIQWYGRVFGFEPVEAGIRDGTRWAVVRSGDFMLCLGEYPRFQAPGEDLPVHQIYHFGLRVADPAAWEKTVEAEGLFVSYGGAVRYPHSTSWYVQDPTGHEIEVVHWDGDRVSFEGRPR